MHIYKKRKEGMKGRREGGRKKMHKLAKGDSYDTQSGQEITLKG